jgi:anaerobic selenocysteine-containing dehydrogenase
MWDGWAELATRDAERLGIATGDQIELTSEAGSIEVPAVVRPEARPGTIALPLGPGHRDYGRYARGRGSNPPDLIGADSVEGTTSPVLSGRVRVLRTGKAKLALYGRGLRQAEHIPTGWAPMKKGH